MHWKSADTGISGGATTKYSTSAMNGLPDESEKKGDGRDVDANHVVRPTINPHACPNGWEPASRRLNNVILGQGKKTCRKSCIRPHCTFTLTQCIPWIGDQTSCRNRREMTAVEDERTKYHILGSGASSSFSSHRGTERGIVSKHSTTSTVSDCSVRKLTWRGTSWAGRRRCFECTRAG